MKRTILLVVGALISNAWGMDIDTGRDARGVARLLDSQAAALMQDGWARLRGADLDNITETRDALRVLRAHNLKTCVMLRMPVENWVVSYLPTDLRKAHENGRRLGQVFGDMVDAWEVDNEPDLGFVPEAAENYAAFLKVTYLGIQAGYAAAKTKPETGNLKPAGSDKNTAVAQDPLVIMGSLGLPPGPWLERFAANDGFSYTDGFNYHYYGYAEDFTGVYKQFENAVQKFTEKSREKADFLATKRHENAQNKIHTANSAASVLKKDWPVFLTEIGYGMLGKAAMNENEGRMRQWRWFKSVGEQAAALRIEAPMAFYLPPYLEYGTFEFGLTVPAERAVASGKSGSPSPEGYGAIHPATRSQARWSAGGIEYRPEDFGVKESESWMELIGKEIGGNQVTPALAWWLARPRKGGATRLPVDSHRWTVTTTTPSPIVIDFIAGEDLQSLKRFNGNFVTGNTPPGLKPEEAKPVLPPVVRPPKPPKSPRSEEFMIHVRTENGNLFEVYPTRMATPDWQTYLEHQGNFTMSFYGRAALPWRFRDNMPVSLAVVMYPKQLPATYEFRRLQLIRLGEVGHEKALEDTKRPALYRYGQGKVVLYNFSDKPVTGKLWLPAGLTTENTEDTEMMTLTPDERREVSVVIQVGATRFERNQAVITFVPADGEIFPARFVTEFFPALEGLKTSVVAQLLTQKTEDSRQKTASNSLLAKHEIMSSRPLATEEARGILQPATGFFAQQGAKVVRTADGFRVMVTGTPPSKEQRVEVEFPWPEGLAFDEHGFLSLEYRLNDTPKQ